MEFIWGFVIIWAFVLRFPHLRQAFSVIGHFKITLQMKKHIILIVLLLFTISAFGQNTKYVNAEILNVRQGAGIQYNTIGQVGKGSRVTVISENNGWTEIETTTGAKGFVATEYLSLGNQNAQNSNNDKKDTSWISVLITLGILGYVSVKVKNFLFGRSNVSAPSSSSSRTTSIEKQEVKKQEVKISNSKSAVYKFRVKGNGSAGNVKYTDGMNVEVAASRSSVFETPFNTTVEKIFIQEFARKYNVEPSSYSGIKMLFKRDYLDVEVL